MSARSANELHLTRVYDAPVELVWDAWVEPDQVAQWWGPRGFTLTSYSKDVRPGGQWIYTMHGPDGVDYPSITTYLEVEERRRLVYDHGASGDKPPLFRVTALFTPLGRRTRLDLTMTLPSPEAARATREFIKRAGGDSTWDRLAEYLDKRSTGKERFILNRSFAAPRAAVFAAWTDPARLSRWLPPEGFTMEFARADIRPGGTSFYSMSAPGGARLYGRCEYRSIAPPERLVYTQQFADQDERVTRHPMSPTWPETIITTVTFTEESPHQTRITIEWDPTPDTPPQSIETFAQSRPNMTQGWTSSLDKLENLLTPA